MYTHTSKGVVTYNKGFTINMEYNKAFKPLLSYSKMMKKDTTYFMLKIGFSIYNLLDILVKCFMCSTSTLDNVNVSIDICKDEIKDYRLHFDKKEKRNIYGNDRFGN